MDAHVRRGHPILFGVIAVFALIELGITASIVKDSNDAGNPITSLRDRSRFLLFNSIWTFVFSLFYLIGFITLSGNFLLNIFSHGLFIFITWLFWLVGAATWSSLLGGSLDCGLANYFGVGPACSRYNAAEAFAWIEWALFTIALVFIVFLGIRASRGGSGFGGPVVA